MRRTQLILPTVLAVLLVSGCSGQGTGSDPADDAPPPSASEPATGSESGGATDSDEACAGGVLTISERDTDHNISVDCDEIRITADDVDLEARSVGTLIIEARDVDVDADEIGTVQITGNENDVDVDGPIDTLTVDGDDNEVSAVGNIGSITDNGNNNEIETD